MDTQKRIFPSFGFEAATLSAYILTLDTFIISLKNGRVIHHIPEDVEKFEHWLAEHKVRNVQNAAL